MMVNFSESGHPVFCVSIHFKGSEENIELLLRMIISANQLSIYGAIADLCKESGET